MAFELTPEETQIRRAAERVGLWLKKSRGRYWLIAPEVNSTVAGGDNGLTLDGIAAWLKGRR